MEKSENDINEHFYLCSLFRIYVKKKKDVEFIVAFIFFCVIFFPKDENKADEIAVIIVGVGMLWWSLFQ